jgi:hypothetical protein
MPASSQWRDEPRYRGNIWRYALWERRLDQLDQYLANLKPIKEPKKTKEKK